MVTAAHVLRHYSRLAPSIGTETARVPMPGPYISTREGGDRCRPIDTYDFAFREVPEDEANKLHDCRFLTGDRIAINEPLTATSDGTA